MNIAVVQYLFCSEFSAEAAVVRGISNNSRSYFFHLDFGSSHLCVGVVHVPLPRNGELWAAESFLP